MTKIKGLCRLDLELIQNVLLDPEISGWKIEKGSEKFGSKLSRTAVSLLRNPTSPYSLTSIRVDKLIAIQKWIYCNGIDRGQYKTAIRTESEIDPEYPEYPVEPRTIRF